MFNVKFITYGQNLREVRVYQKPIGIGKPPTHTGKRGEGSEHAQEESLRRTRAVIRDIGLSNTWTHFVTLTFNPDLVDSFNYDACVDKLSQWLKDSRKRKAPDMQYLMVPELHKSGRWHFHGLMNGIAPLDLTDSLRRDRRGRVIYNIGRYKLGFTTATEIGDQEKAVYYLLKYITKDLCSVTFNRKRYWASRDLVRAETTTDLLQDDDRKTLEDVLQGSSDRTGTLTINAPGYKNTIRYYQARTV